MRLAATALLPLASHREKERTMKNDVLTLLEGEDANAYADMFALVSAAPPSDIGEIFAREFTDITWDIRRYRRAKLTLLADWLPEVLERSLGAEHHELLNEFAAGKSEAIAKVEELMAQNNLTNDTVINRALVDASN
jgi:hypothetical protein